MKQKLVLFITLILMTKILHSQIIDRYGINFGTSYSTQIWDYKLIDVDMDYKYKFGLQAFLQAEKDFGNLLAMRTEFGYIQKGFKNNVQFTFPNGTPIETSNNNNVILHDLALNLGLKIKPVKIDYFPYFLIELQGNYMIVYEDIEIVEPGSGLKFNMYESTIENFNKFNFGGLVGLGIDIKHLIYFEVEYNPNFTNNFEDKVLRIKDNCWGAKIGLNINKLID